MTNVVRAQESRPVLVSTYAIPLWQLYRSDREISSITFRTKSGNIYLLDCYGDISSTRDQERGVKPQKVRPQSAVHMDSRLFVGKVAIIPMEEDGTVLQTTEVDYIAYSLARIENIDEARRLVESNPNLPSMLRKDPK